MSEAGHSSITEVVTQQYLFAFSPVRNSLRAGTVFATLVSLFNAFGVECRLIFFNNTRSTVEWSKMEKKD